MRARNSVYMQSVVLRTWPVWVTERWAAGYALHRSLRVSLLGRTT